MYIITSTKIQSEYHDQSIGKDCRSDEANQTTHREGCVGINLVLGGDAEAGVAVPGGPSQVDGRLQLTVDLLVDGATELGAVVPEGGEEETKREPIK